MEQTLKVSVSGVRGIVGASFTPQVAASFAQAFGALVGNGRVLVGRDTRTTGLMIECAVVAGLQSVGCRPLLAGVVPTPTLLLLTPHLGALGGIAITASHNPAPWNALKFFGPRGMFLDETRAEELFDIYHQQEFPLVSEPDIPEARGVEHPFRIHADRVAGYVDAEAIRKRRFRVAVDCGNGVGALYSAPFLRERLGCDVIPLFDDPSGVFEREPEPAPGNLEALCRTVVEHQCDVGFAQDPDGDRLTLVDESGRALSEDLTLAFAVRQVLGQHRRGPVAINQSTSKAVEMVARELGSEVVRTKIGEINVSQTMLRMGAVVGGESNGGVIVPEIHPCRDSFTGMALVLELLAQDAVPLSAARARMPRFEVVRDKVSTRPDQAPGIMRALRRHFEGCPLTLQDGVFVDFGERWVHVRRSNTESVIRITAEAPEQPQALALVAEVREVIDAAM